MSNLIAHLQRIANGSTRVKEDSSPLVAHLKEIANKAEKGQPAGKVNEKSPFLPHYNGEIPPLYKVPTDRQKERGQLTLFDKFYLANQNYSKGGTKQ
jgi:hypothetical protein